MQIFLLSRRSTASGNGIGSAPTTARYKTSVGGGRIFAGAPGPPPVLDLADGTLAARLARDAVVRATGAGPSFRPPPELPPVFHEPRGVFVTWYEHARRDLRGCIGFPEAVLPLGEALGEAAVSAALEDPRFRPVTAAELRGLVVEVSVLTPLEPVPLAGRPGAVRVGTDGLVVERGRRRGLLLPQVAPEQGWDREEFLDGACTKAGLPTGAWRSADVAVLRFQAEIFRELTPAGDVVRGAP